MPTEILQHGDIVLVIAAHPDDEVLGCGATIARLAQDEHPVSIAILGEGITSRFSGVEAADKKLVSVLRDQYQKATQLLGVRDIFFSSFPDNRFDTVPLLDIIKEVENLIERTQPTVIFTHHGGDLNVDHQITYRAVLTATRPTEKCPVREVYSFEIPSSTEWVFAETAPAFRPNVFVDVTETLDLKIQAMQIYETEARDFPHPRSPEALRAISQRWGSTVGLKAAEAFQLIRSVC